MTPIDRDPRDRDPAARDSSSAPGALAARVPAHAAPPALEQRVVDSLARRGLLAPSRSGDPRRSRHRGWRAMALLATAAALFVGGVFAGRGRPPASLAPDSTARYALLLYGGADWPGGDAEAARVDEYRQWARALAGRGHLVTGEKLRNDALELVTPGAGALPSGTGSPSDGVLGGFFIISASSAAEAEAIARTMPHLQHGGRVVVRPIEPT
ncbi:MAG TPA: YciI family protein [Gemmatimonadaceae bacterium]|nr:YciI family protein [Gemmatimonadaceae bacterium]